MAEMGNGYGSEYQLLRFLGHHRNELNMYIKKALNIESEIEWLDFPYDDNRLSGDGEYIGIEFLDSYSDILAQWKKFWPSLKKAQHWDAIAKTKDTWLLIEAKAHSKEMISDCTAREKSKEVIEYRMMELIKRYNITPQGSRLKKYYQKANRILFISFLESIGIRAQIVFIYFINGYKNIGIENAEEWESLIKEQDMYLGIEKNEWVKDHIKNIIIDCKMKKMGI